MPVSAMTQAVIERLQKARVISVVSAPALRLGNVRALILLSQAIYWTSRDKSVVPANGWLSKPAAEWAAETGLSRAHLASAVTTLQEQGVLKTWQKAKQAPWWKLDLQSLHALSQGRPAKAAIPLARFCSDASYRENMLGKPLPYYALLAEAVGDALTGFFLSRCVYWQAQLEQRNRLEGDKSFWGWTSTDWTSDIGISRSQLRTAMKDLAERGLIASVEIGRPYPGVHVNMEQLGAIVKAISVPYYNIGAGQPQIATVPCGDFGEVGEIDKCGRFSAVRTTVHTCLATPDSVGQEEIARCAHFSALRTSVHTLRFMPEPESARASISLSSISSIAGFDTGSTASNAESAQPFAGFDQSIAGFSQSTRAQGFDYSETTTNTLSTGVHCSQALAPTPADVVVAKEGQQDLIFPKAVSETDKAAMAQYLTTALPHRRQALLDEFAGRLAANTSPIQNPIGYLRRLVTLDTQAGGNLLLDFAGSVLARRQRQAENARHLAAVRAMPVPQPVSTQSQATKPNFAALYAAIGRRRPNHTEAS